MGPTAALYLREPLGEQGLAELGRWIHDISTGINEEARWRWKFLCHDGRRLGTDLPCEDSCPLDVLVDDISELLGKPDDNIDDLSWEQRNYFEANQEEYEFRLSRYAACLGYVPQQAIHTWASCNEPVDHYILGLVTLQFAEKYNAMIDMHGKVMPPVQSSGTIEYKTIRGIFMGERTMFIDHRIEETREFVNRIPGRICELHDLIEGMPLESHIVDVAFMQNWLQHPHFHM